MSALFEPLAAVFIKCAPLRYIVEAKLETARRASFERGPPIAIWRFMQLIEAANQTYIHAEHPQDVTFALLGASAGYVRSRN